MVCILQDEELNEKQNDKISLSLSDRHKWKKSSHSSTRSCLDLFFHTASLLRLPPKAAAKYICWRRKKEEGLAEETVYLSDMCGSSPCLFSVPTSFKTTFQTAASQTDYAAKAFRRWTHSRASSLNFMHNLSPPNVLKTLKRQCDWRLKVGDRLLTGEEEQWPSRRAQRDATSVRNAVIITTLSTSLQAVVTNNQLLAARFTRVRDPLLVKTCQEGGGKQRQGMRNWGKGQAWMLQLLLWNWTWTSCKVAAMFQHHSSGRHLWHRGHGALYMLRVHHLCSPTCSLAADSFHTLTTLAAVQPNDRWNVCMNIM